jgi:hypothetical protein
MDDGRYALGSNGFDWGALTSTMAPIGFNPRYTSEPCTQVAGGQKAYMRSWNQRSQPSEDYLSNRRRLTERGCKMTGIEKRQVKEWVQHGRCRECTGEMITRTEEHDAWCCPPISPVLRPPTVAPPGTCPTNCTPRWTTATGRGHYWACDCAPYRPPSQPPIRPGTELQAMPARQQPFWREPWFLFAGGLAGGFAIVTLLKRR